jgi:hypothetical protein
MAATPFNLKFEDSLAKSGHWSTMLGEESGDQSACLISSAVFLTNLKPLPPHCILLQWLTIVFNLFILLICLIFPLSHNSHNSQIHSSRLSGNCCLLCSASRKQLPTPQGEATEASEALPLPALVALSSSFFVFFFFFMEGAGAVRNTSHRASFSMGLTLAALPCSWPTQSLR